MLSYQEFVAKKRRSHRKCGFTASHLNGNLYPFQKHIVNWACELGRAAIFADCVILSPFAGIGSEGYVAIQEGRKFVGIELKPEYFQWAVRNLKSAESAHQPSLFCGDVGMSEHPENIQELREELERLRAIVAEPLPKREPEVATRANLDQIATRVAEHFGLTRDQIRLKTNQREITHARHQAVWAMRQLTDASLPMIGRYFGGKHHTTILHSEKWTEKTLLPIQGAKLLAVAKGEQA